MRVQINPTAVASLGLEPGGHPLGDRRRDGQRPKGSLNGLKQSLTLDATDQLFDAAAFNAVIVAYRNGAPVRIGDIGKAIDGVEDVRQAAWLGDKRAVIIDVHKQPGYNINQTVQLVKEALPELERSLPPSIKVQVLGDRTQTIRGRSIDVQVTMALSIGLVVMVVFLFLRKASATLIPSVTIPVSLLATCAVMYLLGYTIDNVSLMALTIAVGFVIDDAVVMVENIVRHIEAGEAPLEAALKGSREIGFTIISMTLSLVAVFIPLLLMGGLIGRLFREFAVTISVAILVSGVVSLVLTPMMCAQLLKPMDHDREGGPPRHGARTGLRPVAWRLCGEPASGAAAPRRHHAAVRRDARRDRLPLCHHPEGLLPPAGQRDHRGQHGSRSGHLL